MPKGTVPFLWRPATKIGTVPAALPGRGPILAQALPGIVYDSMEWRRYCGAAFMRRPPEYYLIFSRRLALSTSSGPPTGWNSVPDLADAFGFNVSNVARIEQ